MRPLSLLPFLLAASLSAQTADKPAATRPPKEAAIERMLGERDSPEALAKAIEAARKLGATEQSVIEARFLFAVDKRDDAALAAMVPEFLKRKDAFKPEESEIFALKEDWLAVVEYVQAIDAMRKGDKDAFKRHITEAFWLSPGQGAAYATHIERMRMDDAMRGVTLDPAIALAPLQGEGKVKLSALAEKKKALLLHFWSPWSRECEDTLPDFAVTARELESKGVAVATLIVGDEEGADAETKEMLAKLDGKRPGAWLIDDARAPLAHLFRVSGVPVMVLLSPEGKVIFNGDPSDEGLWKELVKIAPDVKRPALTSGGK